MKKIVVGILAHVDSGKTTLSEALLYQSGNISKIGRVDNRDSFLDTFSLERARGITIFSKQAVLNYKDTQFTLIDTPGHVDFSAETERTLQVLDYAILVVSGNEKLRRIAELKEKYIRDEQASIEYAQNEGKRQQSIKIAKNMLKENVNIDFISKITELSIEEIEKLK